MLPQVRTVTFGIIAYNEQQYLPDLLNDLLSQTYPKDRIEVILVDGDSSDDTWNLMQAFKDRCESSFLRVLVLHNPKRIQPAGWNIVITNSTADMLLRIDAHARIPKDFIQRSVERINAGEFVCGGPRANIIDEETPWKSMLLGAEQAMFGSGFASYRRAAEKITYVKSVFHAAYRREVLCKVGLFNEDLQRTEDNEYHYRVAQAGYKICYDPAITSFYQTRNSLKAMLRQKHLNGLWIGKTLFVCPGCISLFHLVPCGFVFSIGATGALAVVGIVWPALTLWAAYGAVDALMTLSTFVAAPKKSACYAALPAVFFLLHAGYGVGTVRGISSMLYGRARRGGGTK